jgi:transposase
MTDSEHQRAQALRREGLTYKAIAEQLGSTKGIIYRWLNPAFAERQRANSRALKRRYAGTCETCGAKTSGRNGPGAAAPVCANCLTWTEEDIIDAMREWAAAHDGIPPRSTDWRKVKDGYPSFNATIIKRVGWNELLLRAGCQLHQDRRPQTQAEIERMLREGASTREVAERVGTTEGNIRQRLYIRGLSVAELRQAA